MWTIPIGSRTLAWFSALLPRVCKKHLLLRVCKKHQIHEEMEEHSDCLPGTQNQLRGWHRRGHTEDRRQHRTGHTTAAWSCPLHTYITLEHEQGEKKVGGRIGGGLTRPMCGPCDAELCPNILGCMIVARKISYNWGCQSYKCEGLGTNTLNQGHPQCWIWTQSVAFGDFQAGSYPPSGRVHRPRQ